MTTRSSNLAGEFHGHSGLVGYSPLGHKESDINERQHFDTFSQTAELSPGPSFLMLKTETIGRAWLTRVLTVRWLLLFSHVVCGVLSLQVGEFSRRKSFFAFAQCCGFQLMFTQWVKM